MALVVWIESLLQTLLSAIKLPAWVIIMIMTQIKEYLTPDLVVSLEQHIACYVCAKAKAFVGSDPDDVAKASLALLETILGCGQCPPDPVQPPPAA